MPSVDAAPTEQIILQKLEESGQYGKMRAMIMEAALHTVDSSATAGLSAATPHPFTPSPALREAKRSGAVELNIVADYLSSLGLSYTESVLRMEAGIAANAIVPRAELQRKLGIPASPSSSSTSCLSALLRGNHTALGPLSTEENATTTTPNTAAAAEAAAQAAIVTAAPAPTAVTAAKRVEVDADASDHDQPGAEDTTYYISNWRRRHFMRHHQVSGQQVQLDRLIDCHTVVLDELDSMTVDDCEGGELVIAACEGSVFLRNCRNMIVHVACKQLRTRDCDNIQLHIFTSTDPVVEMSHHVEFYPFHLRLPALRSLFAEARLDAKSNRFVHVYDFTPSEPGLPQPHFTVHFPDHQQRMEDRCADHGAPECPPELEQLLTLQLMPAASSESGKNKSYNIKTGAQVWAATSAVPVVTAAVTANDGAGLASSSGHSSVHSSSVSDVASDEDFNSTAESGDGSAASAPRRRILDPLADVPSPTAHAAAPVALAAAAAAEEEEGYSSFDDDDDASAAANDTYEVEEDEDDF